MLQSLDQQLLKLKHPVEYTPALLLAYSEALEKYQTDAQQQAQLLAAMSAQTGRKINDQDNLMGILNQSVHGQFLDCLDDFTKLQQKFQAFLSKNNKKGSSPAIVVAAPAAAANGSSPATADAANGSSPDAGDKKKKKKKKNKNKAEKAGAKPEADVDGKEKEKTPSPSEQKEQKPQPASDSNQK